MISQDDLIRLIARQKEFIQQHHIMADLPNKGVAARRQYFAMCAVRDGRPIPSSVATKENVSGQHSLVQSALVSAAAHATDQKIDAIMSRLESMTIAAPDLSKSKLITPAAFSRFVTFSRNHRWVP